MLRAVFISNGTQLLSASSDGLIKLWSIKTNECINTFDGHTDKVWALAVRKDEDQFITGGADSLIHVWKDYTDIEEEQKHIQTQDRMLKEQDLMNSIYSKNYKKAINLAFALEQPFRLLTTFESALADGAETVVDDVISNFSKPQLETFLKYVREWNTTAKHSGVSQVILKKLFTTFPPSAFESLTDIKQVCQPT